jgi:hypothetical protein
MTKEDVKKQIEAIDLIIANFEEIRENLLFKLDELEEKAND